MTNSPARRWLRIVAVAVPVAMVSALGVGIVWAQHGPPADHPVAVAGSADTTPARPIRASTVGADGVDLPTSTAPSTIVAPSKPTPAGPPTTTVGPPRTTPTTTAPPDETAAAHDLQQQGLYLVDADTGAVKPVLLHYTFENVSFSPDGRQLVFAGRVGDDLPDGVIPTRLWTIDTDGSRLTPIALDKQNPEEPSWSPDGRWIGYYAYPVNTNGDEALYLMDAVTKASHFVDYVDQGRAPLEWSPDSATIAIASPNHHTITVIDAASATKTEASVPIEAGPNNGPNDLYDIGWSHDGSQLIGSYGAGPVFVTDASGNGLHVISTGGHYARPSPTADVASEWIDFSAYLQPLAGGPARLLAPGYDPRDWSHDGHLIAGEAGEKTIAAIDSTTGRAHELIQETVLGVSPAGWAPSGHVFAVIAEQSAARRY